MDTKSMHFSKCIAELVQLESFFCAQKVMQLNLLKLLGNPEMLN
jgi:hypothetical protein